MSQDGVVIYTTLEEIHIQLSSTKESPGVLVLKADRIRLYQRRLDTVRIQFLPVVGPRIDLGVCRVHELCLALRTLGFQTGELNAIKAVFDSANDNKTVRELCEELLVGVTPKVISEFHRILMQQSL